jgi:SAM-dependent methyltransferase
MLSVAARERLRSSVPWWLKCALKLALVSLPVDYRLLRGLSLAGHGGMRRPPFAHDAFRRHYEDGDFHRKAGGFTVLELGPGDALTAALVARAYGAASSCHVDVAPFATRDVAVYRAVARHLREQGLPAPDLSAAKSLEDVLAVCRGRYETRGLASLRALPGGSFDLIFSNGVLQCVPPALLLETLKETRRLLHPQGVCVHSIDLRDMMGHSLHHLRFGERVWESAWFRRAGFHTNRLRYSEWLRLFRSAGFDVRESEVNRWPTLPVARESLAPPYRDLPESDLLVSTIRVALSPSPTNTAPPNARQRTATATSAARA